MRQLGWIKRFDNIKGFGIIQTHEIGEVFIHQNNFISMPRYIKEKYFLVFDNKEDNRGLTAINVTPVSTYDDFKIILEYLLENPTFHIESYRKKYCKRGRYYSKIEYKFLKLVDYALNQLLQERTFIEVFEFFKNYFDDHHNNITLDFIIKYFEITKTVIRDLKLNLNGTLKEEYQTMMEKLKERDKEINKTLSLEEVLEKPYQVPCPPNDFVIKKLFSHYLKNTGEEIHFELWKNHNNIIGEQSFHYFDEISEEKITLNISNELLSQYFDLYDYRQLFWICHRFDGEVIAYEIVKKRILTLDMISESSIYNILRSFDAISNLGSVISLRQFFLDRLIELLKATDITDINEGFIEMFNLFLDTIRNENNRLDYTYAIRKFNENALDIVKFRLWQETRYFEADKDFLFLFISQLSYDDYLNASASFHEEHFHNELKKITDFNSIENFCLLTFLIVETPYKAIQEVFPKLEPEYQVSYWMNFPKGTETSSGKYHEAPYELSDVPFTTDDLLLFLQHIAAIEELIISYEIVKSIQNEYKTKTRNKKEGFRLMDFEARMETAKYLINQSSLLTNEKIVDFLHDVLNRSNNNVFPIFKEIFPLTEKIFPLEISDLVKVLNRSRINEKNKQEISKYFSKQTSKYNRIHLWLKGYIKEVDFDEIIEVFGDFKISEQPMLFRKLFSIIHRKKQLANDTYINKILLINEKGNINLNVGICLAVLKSLKYQNAYFEDNIISEIISDYVKENISNLIQIDDLFEECHGRTLITKDREVHNFWYINIESKDFLFENNAVEVNGLSYQIDNKNRTVEIEGETFHFTWRKEETQIHKELYERPEGITFCDAIKSQRDEVLNKEYWWCCNKKCYEARQNDHIHLEWSFYSLRDFINILGLSFEEDKYYRFLGVVNRANRLMSRLMCQSCKQLLRDAKSSKYAFYRVTTFHCTNPKCPEKHIPVYLNHCLNWRCLNIVDSRVSTTCPNGWFICDSCGSCCSHDKLVKRLEYLKANNIFNPNNKRHQELQSQVDNKLGHMEKGERFDFKTGLKNE